MRDKIKLLIVSTYNPEDISTAANAALIAYLPIIFECLGKRADETLAR